MADSEKWDSSEEESMNTRLSIDLVAASRRLLLFIRRVSESQWWLHHPTSLLQSIRRYDELWMPLISDLNSAGSMSTQMLLPPLDVQWVWFCHTLNPSSYRLYCESRFSKLIEKASIVDDENEEYAMNRCRDIWSCKYPSEPFDLEEPQTDSDETIITDKTIMDEVSKHSSLYSKFYKPYKSEIVYLIAARKRYQRFLYLLQKFRDGYSKLVPTLDIQLMWLTHQSYPVVYAGDVKEMEGDLGKVVGVWDKVEDEQVKATKRLWERMFDQPYEKTGATIDEIVGRPIKSPVYWEVWNSDVNGKYKSLEPRFLLEVCVSMRADQDTKELQQTCLRLRTVRCHGELKFDKPSISVPSDAWRKMWHFYCEFGTRGVTLELRRKSGGSSTCCKKQSSSLRRSTVVFLWNELLRAPSLTLERDLGQQRMRAVASITPPTQAPYLLKCVSDRVTDDSGAMISDVILKINRYRPQEGRWLTRTVLDHAGRECFVLRIRMGSGIWRRGGETPKAVKKEERIIEVREGSWNYVGGAIGRAPSKVVATATPKEEDPKENKSSWSLSNGDELTIQRDSTSLTSSGFTFNYIHNQTSHHDSVRLLKGRKMQYQVVANEVDHDTVDYSKQKEEQEEDFVTLVRYTAENPNGRATALINWRLLVVEVSPEEDAVVVLLMCMAILRSVTEMKKEDLGGLLVRRRLTQTQLGLRDWGSVLLLHPKPTSTNSSAYYSPHLQPWYWNPTTVMASPTEADHKITSRQPTALHYSPAEGDDKLYKRGLLIIP